ncbi:MAG: 8-amino-7-oxononanoate synthase, partial [Actinomycetota bacterium]|nr:8-amino-7-oxononanoate synthase [Actinomycetota bacterium]
MRSWAEWSAEEARVIRAAGRWREIVEFEPGGSVVSFASNDYLGLTQHPAVVGAAREALDRWGAGAGAARLVVGTRAVHGDLEQSLADWKREEAALLFSTGYAANLGVLTTFGTAGTRILSDERNHASIVDGCRLAAAVVDVYRHADVGHVEWLLANTDQPAIVVTDTVFSMDGDLAPVEALAEVCSQAGALLVLDEAHAVLGPDPDLDGVEHLRVGTLSKYLGSLGGFVAGTRPLVDLLVNRARTFIFTTAPTPADTAAALAALKILRSPEGEGLTARLRSHVERVQPGHLSPMVPVIVGDDNEAMRAAAALLDRGLLVPAIRPPTVPAGTSRLRVTLSAIHT